MKILIVGTCGDSDGILDNADFALIELTDKRLHFRVIRKAARPFIRIPDGVKLFNGCNEPCDTLVGPCCCRAWHCLRDVIELCKQKGIYTKLLEDTFKRALPLS